MTTIMLKDRRTSPDGKQDSYVAVELDDAHTVVRLKVRDAFNKVNVGLTAEELDQLIPALVEMRSRLPADKTPTFRSELVDLLDQMITNLFHGEQYGTYSNLIEKLHKLADLP